MFSDPWRLYVRELAQPGQRDTCRPAAFHGAHVPCDVHVVGVRHVLLQVARLLCLVVAPIDWTDMPCDSNVVYERHVLLQVARLLCLVVAAFHGAAAPRDPHVVVVRHVLPKMRRE